MEFNNTIAQALTLPENSSTVGHVGYYYNNYRDSLDWYKLTTTDDGMINVTITSQNGNYMYVQFI